MAPPAQIVVITGRPDEPAVLPPQHALGPVTYVRPTEASDHVRELRARRIPAVVVLDGGSVNLAPILTEFAVKYPDVPLVVATEAHGSDAAIPARGVRRPAGSEALVGAIRDASRTALQQTRVRTTLDHFNIRLRTPDAAGDEKQQRTLLLSGLYLSSVLEQARDAIFVTDRTGVVALWNRAAEQLFGVASREIIGRRIDVLGEPCNGPGLLTLIGQISPQAPVQAAEFTCGTATGQRDAEVSLSLVSDQEGAGIAVSGIVRDVTERNALYRELQQKSDALAASNRHKEEFLAVLSHELRTPLNTVLGWAHMLERMPQDPVQVRRAAEMIARNASMQWRLVTDLLEYARIKAGQLGLDRRLADLSALTKTTVEGLRPELERRSLIVRQELEPAVCVSIDSQRMVQVLSNLLSNAIKFTPRGGEIVVSVRRVDTQAELQVRDTGRGIDPAFLPHVFDEFRQADASTTRTEQGLGLGLAISRRIVDLHGGSITAHSEGRGHGATFTITLALAETPSAVCEE